MTYKLSWTLKNPESGYIQKGNSVLSNKQAECFSEMLNGACKKTNEELQELIKNAEECTQFLEEENSITFYYLQMLKALKRR